MLESGARNALEPERRAQTMVHALVALTALFTAADHWTTYLCLRAPVPGWQVIEANPIADWLFTAVGLVPGILIDSVLTVGAITFLLLTPLVPRVAKGCFFFVVAAWTGYAVVNNFRAIAMMGLSPLGLA